MNSFAAALDVLNQMKAGGVVRDYAVAGAMALVFWAEPIPTYDLDVLVWLPEAPGPIISLAHVYAWASERGHAAEAEHIVVAGVPVQLLPAHDPLADEAIATAMTLDYAGVPVRVVRPEYLIALYLEPSARTRRRQERAALLAESPAVERDRLTDLLARYNLEW